MKNIFKHGITFLLCFSLFLLLSQKAFAVSSVKLNRIAGDNRYKTSVEISKTGWPQGSQYVVLATSENYPDALSAAPLAKKYNCPILLTGNSKLDSDTAAELKRLKTKQVLIIGGLGVISESVEEQLKLMGLTPERIAGVDRYDTSIKVAEKLGTSGEIVVVTGENYPDAISIAPIAAKKNMPIILSPAEDITDSIKSYLKDKKISKTYIIGNYEEISENVEKYFENSVRITGYDKYEKNINILKYFYKDIDLNTVYFATGEDYPDALAASVLAQKTSSPVILTDRYTQWITRDFISSKVINTVIILGGYGAISYQAGTALQSLPARIKSIESMSITIFENEKYEMPKTVAAKLSNNVIVEVPVKWNLSYINTNRSGTYNYEGTVNGYEGIAYLSLTIKPIVSSVENLTAEIVKDSSYIFPSSVIGRMSDNSLKRFTVNWSTSSVTITKVGSYTFQGSIEGTTKKVTLSLQVIEDKVINFDDTVLRDIICSSLDKAPGSTIYKSELLTITDLSTNSANIGNAIKSLKGIESLSNLVYLELSNHALNNISQLTSLKNLKTLILDNNAISTINPLQNLYRLTYLDLSYNKILDVSYLRNLTGLRNLLLGHNINGVNELKDFSPTRQYYNNLSERDFYYSN